MLFTTAQKFSKHLGYFCHKICCQKIPKIAQSGHTECHRHRRIDSFRRQCDQIVVFLLFGHLPTALKKIIAKVSSNCYQTNHKTFNFLPKTLKRFQSGEIWPNLHSKVCFKKHNLTDAKRCWWNPQIIPNGIN